MHRRGRLPACLAAALACVVLGATGAAAPGGRSSSPQAGLEGLLEPGPLLLDENGDGVVDRVAASFLLGHDPDPADLVAAAQVALRLGFETSAMDLPLPRGAGDDGVGIAVGRGGLTRAGLLAELEAELEPGVGVVALLRAGGHRWLAVAGGDGAGTAAAATYIAGRFPRLWDPDGATLGDLTDGLAAVLGGRRPRLLAIRVRGVRTRHEAAGLERVDVEVSVADPGALRETVRTLRRLAEEARTLPGRPAPALPLTGVHHLRVTVAAPGVLPVVVEIPGAPPAPLREPLGRRARPGAKARLDLSSLYTTDGLLGDGDGDLLPDRVDVLLSPAAEAGGDAVVDVAARLGLESTGIGLPVAKGAERIADPAREPILLLAGRSHPLVRRLVEDEVLRLPQLEPGGGWIQVVPGAFGDNPAVVVVGADGAGLRRALFQLAERLPHVWDRGKDRTTLDDVEEDLWRFLSGRSPAGQAATALYKLDRILDELGDREPEELRVSVHLEKAAPGLESVVRRLVQERFPAAQVEVEIDDLYVENARLLIDERIQVPSEVADFWRLFREEVLPRVRPGQAVAIEARLSEPPEVRERIRRQVLAELAAAGAAAAPADVRILCAYKQGYSWLYDVVRPALEGKPVQRLAIRFAEIGPPPEWKQQAMYAPTRWLLEIFPIDEVLARELDLDLRQIEFEMTPRGSPAYEVIATAADGSELYRATFEPRWVLRPYFDRFPEYERVRVTTGWIHATVEGRTVVDRRIVTDLERFWDHFQARTLPALYDYVMEITEGKPDPADAPLFGELRVEVSLSEPDYRVGVDQEQIASMEALHEEIYFGTLHFLDLLGRIARGTPLRYPGRVIPVVRPKADGGPGQARITLTGFGARRPSVVVTYGQGDDGEGRRRRRYIPRVELERPRALAALVRDGRPGIERLRLRVKVDSEDDRWEELVLRAREEVVDRQVFSAEQGVALIEKLEALREAGLYTEALAFRHLGTLEVAFGWEWEIDEGSEVVALLRPNGTPEPPPDIGALLPAGYRYRGEPLVQWETPMPPREAYGILAKMSAFPEATVYRVGESYLGQDIWAMDLMAPVRASHWSQAKASALKPTVIYSARQHANEVSSTSHVLKLAELLLTDPELRRALDRVNVVIHPVTNPDGAQLAYELYRITPNHMLHAGYLGSLGVDVTAGQWDDDPIYPESRVRPKLWRTWLPDIFLNPHGYPSHEWVQLFSEYAAWVRNRVTEARSWWGMRGWFMPGFTYLDDPDYPDHKRAAFEIRRRIVEGINAVPELRALNERAYDRYRRYGFEWDRDNFKLDFTGGVLIYTALKGARAGAELPRGGFMVRHPKVTIWEGGTEAPDETAEGDWLRLVATAGLQWDRAILDYLLDGHHVVERQAEELADGLTLRWHRRRPPAPGPQEAAPRPQ